MATDPKSLKKMYRTIRTDSFPRKVTVTFSDDEGDQSLVYEKVEWEIAGEKRGLRYGENPDQEAALYRMTNGNLSLGGVESVQYGRYLASNAELLLSGKHPGKINITDADSALNILRYFTDSPCAVIVKHNNPSGVALGDSLNEAYSRAYLADRVAAFGGTVAFNRPVDLATAEAVAESYCEVVVAPDFEDGVLDSFKKWKNLRVMRIADIDRLAGFVGERVIDYKSLIDGGLILQWSFVPRLMSDEDFVRASTEYKGVSYTIERDPTADEIRDMRFGWLVESGITSNSVIYVKNGATVGIGTGEQDRVGVAEIARDKAYRKTEDRISWQKFGIAFSKLDDEDRRAEVLAETRSSHGGLAGSVMISDAFFPFRDGVDVGLNEGVRAVLQPGGSIRDFEAVEACNEHGATMVFTGQRSFRH